MHTKIRLLTHVLRALQLRPQHWLTVLATLTVACSANAATRTWSGAGGNAYWGTDANWGGTAPANGDTVVFPAGAARLTNSNDIPDLRLSQVRYTGAGGGYFVRGYRLTLTNGIAAEHTTGENNFSPEVTLGASQTFSVVSGGTLVVNGHVYLGSYTLTVDCDYDCTFFGSLVDNGNVTKTGSGTLSFSGNPKNLHRGETRVNQGTLNLSKMNGGAIQYGTLVIGDGLGGAESDVVFAIPGVDPQIEPSTSITINKSGLLTVQGYRELQSVTLNGGVLESDIATSSKLTLYSLYNNATAGSPGVVRGLLDFPLDITITTSGHLTTPDLRMEANVVGQYGFHKSGTGTMALTSSNSFGGEVTIASGVLQILNQHALGATSNATVAAGGTLWVADGLTAMAEPLKLSGTNALQFASDATWTGAIELTADAAVSALDAAGVAVLDAIIYGSGGLGKDGPGTLRLTSSFPGIYDGDTRVRAGTLEMHCSVGDSIPHRLIIGGEGADATAVNLGNYEVGQVTVRSRGSWNLNGMKDGVTDLVLENGGDVAAPAPGELALPSGVTVTTSFSPLTSAKSYITGVLRLGGPVEFNVGQSTWFNSDPSDLEIQASIGGTGDLTKSGSGDLGLTASNSFSGNVIVQDGELRVSHSHALSPLPLSSVTLQGDAVLSLSGGITINDEILNLNSSGTPSRGAFHASGETNTWTSYVYLQTNTAMSAVSNAQITITGQITGTGNLVKQDAGTLVFGGSTFNNFVGTVRVEEGTLWCFKFVANAAIPGPLFIGQPSGGSSAVVRLFLGMIEQINDTSAVTVYTGGLLQVEVAETLGALSGSGNVNLTSGGLTVGGNNSSTTFDGVISGSQGLAKSGTGTFTLNGNNSYTGATVVQAGTLLVNGQQRGSAVTVQTTGRLGGSGDVGNLTLLGSGDLAPGASTGQFGCSNLVFNAGTLEAELRGPNLGNSYDSVFVRGTVNLAAPQLGATLGYGPVAGQVFTLIANDGTDAVTGTFSGLPEGATRTINGIPMRVSYAGGDGNDVTLTVSALPLTATRALVGGGNGNGLLDPNECNQLYIVVSNTTGAAVSGRYATLSTTTPGVIITKGDADYPAWSPLGLATNDAPFQVSLLPGFACTTPVDLLLTLARAGEPLFSVSLSLPTGVAGTPVRFDNSTGYKIPDLGSVTSSVVVAGLTTPLAKATVSLHALHPTDSHLGFRLIAPDGTVIVLSEGNGGTADNYGTDCTPDSKRTTFDDGARFSITTSTAPFAGSYRPEAPLSALIGKSGAEVNGTWKLVVTDGTIASVGTLECWSLQLTPLVCPDGGGVCATCLGEVAGTLGTGSATLSRRLFRDYLLSTGCGVYQQCPGWIESAPPFRYAVHWFTNTGPNSCITAVLGVPCGSSSAALQASAYATAFDPALPCTNYLADTGGSVYGDSVGFSFFASAGQRFGIVVNETVAGSGCTNYTLAVYGLPCPPPTVEVAAGSTPVRTRVQWTTSAAGYELQRAPAVGSAPGAWTDVTTLPTVVGGKFTVTNTAPDSTGFFRLRKE